MLFYVLYYTKHHRNTARNKNTAQRKEFYTPWKIKKVSEEHIVL